MRGPVVVEMFSRFEFAGQGYGLGYECWAGVFYAITTLFVCFASLLEELLRVSLRYMAVWGAIYLELSVVV